MATDILYIHNPCMLAYIDTHWGCPKGTFTKNLLSYPLHLVRFCPLVASPPPSRFGRLHLVLHTALWSGSVITVALKMCCSLISSSQHAPQRKDKINSS